MKTVFVINPKAGQGKGIDKLVGAIKKTTLAIERMHLTQILKQLLLAIK